MLTLQSNQFSAIQCVVFPQVKKSLGEEMMSTLQGESLRGNLIPSHLGSEIAPKVGKNMKRREEGGGGGFGQLIDQNMIKTIY